MTTCDYHLSLLYFLAEVRVIDRITLLFVLIKSFFLTDVALIRQIPGNTCNKILSNWNTHEDKL